MQLYLNTTLSYPCGTGRAVNHGTLPASYVSDHVTWVANQSNPFSLSWCLASLWTNDLAQDGKSLPLDSVTASRGKPGFG